MGLRKGQLVKIYPVDKNYKIVIWYKCKMFGLTVDVFNCKHLFGTYLNVWFDTRNAENKYHEIYIKNKVYIVHEENLINNEDLYEE